eukprot:ctg_174.g111
MQAWSLPLIQKWQLAGHAPTLQEICGWLVAVEPAGRDEIHKVRAVGRDVGGVALVDDLPIGIVHATGDAAGVGEWFGHQAVKVGTDKQ